MKRFLFYMLAVVLLGMSAGMTSCQSCGKGEPNESKVTEQKALQNDYDGVVQDFTAGVDNIVAMHRQTMFGLCKGKKYEWRNLQVKFNDKITGETLDDLHVVDVTDVFYYWDNGPWVQYITSNVKKGTLILAAIHDVWIEDADMSDAEIKLWPEDVIKRLKEWNGIVPPADVLILRLPIGPRRCNAQWVIGDIGNVIFVDAVTGEITNWCPAFPNPSVNGPLGEWP